MGEETSGSENDAKQNPKKGKAKHNPLDVGGTPAAHRKLREVLGADAFGEERKKRGTRKQLTTTPKPKRVRKTAEKRLHRRNKFPPEKPSQNGSENRGKRRGRREPTRKGGSGT